MRKRWIYVDGEAIEVGDYEPTPLHHVMPDIQPYQSMVDGSMITSRSRHREHAEHGREQRLQRRGVRAPGK